MAALIPWTAVSTLPASRSWPVVFATSPAYYSQHYLFVIGGWDGSANTRTVYSASVNSTTGALGSWRTNTTNWSGALNYGAGGILYSSPYGWNTLVTVGGGQHNNVSTGGAQPMWASIDLSTGNIANVGTTPNASLSRLGMGFAQYDSSRFFATGGYIWSGSTRQHVTATLLYDMVNGATNLVGSGTALPEGRYGHGMFIRGGNLYVIGGWTASGNTDLSIIYAPINGSSPYLGAWSTLGNIPNYCVGRTCVMSDLPNQRRAIWYAYGTTLYRGNFADPANSAVSSITWNSYSNGFPFGFYDDSNLVLVANRFLFAVNGSTVYMADLNKIPNAPPALQLSGF